LFGWVFLADLKHLIFLSESIYQIYKF